MTVKLVSITPDAEQTMAYIARVSNPSNQDNQKYTGLLKYCIKHNHWSVFEQSTMTLEIETTRAIAAQILRHRSFTFQEFSQRYAASTALGSIALPELRRQDKKNRQNSTDDLDSKLVESFNEQMNTLFNSALSLYNNMLENDVAKEKSDGSTLCALHDKNIYDKCHYSILLSLYNNDITENDDTFLH